MIDECLHPKIAYFGLSKLAKILSVGTCFQSGNGLKGTPIYMSPEILQDEMYSQAGDVYAFAFIIFEIMTCEIPYKNEVNNFVKLSQKVINGYRPTIREDVPDSYRNLIERCWSQDPKERPSFDVIVVNLKENKGFLADTIDEAEFCDYVELIENYQSTFDITKGINLYSFKYKEKEIKILIPNDKNLRRYI